MFVVPDRMKYIDYTDPYDIEPASFMLSRLQSIVMNYLNIFMTNASAKSPNPPQWKAILHPLQTSTWLCLGKLEKIRGIFGI